MLEVNELLSVDAKRFFHQIEASILYDIKEASGKTISANKLQPGFIYHKTMKNKTGRKGNVDIVIDAYENPYQYKASFHSASGVNHVSYVIEEVNEYQIGVTYCEDYEANSKWNQYNERLVSFLYNRRAEKKAIRLLRAIERYLIEESTNEEENI